MLRYSKDSTPQQAREIAPYVDGVVIGSAFVRLIEENRDRDDMVNIVSNYARKIKKSSNISATYTASQVF